MTTAPAIKAWMQTDERMPGVLHAAGKYLWSQMFPQQVEHYDVPLIRLDDHLAILAGFMEPADLTLEDAGQALRDELSDYKQTPAQYADEMERLARIGVNAMRTALCLSREQRGAA